MSEQGERVQMDGVRTQRVARWSAGDAHVWTYRTITVEQVVDTRYVVTLDGRSPVRAGSCAYDDKQQAWQVVQQLMATPDEVGDHPQWRRI